MANTKMSAFTAGGRPLFDDKLGGARAGANVSLTPEDLSGFVTVEARRRRFSFFTDFVNDTEVTANDNALNETNSGSGAASAQQASDGNAIGIQRATTGISSIGRAALASGLSCIRLGTGAAVFEARVNVTTLSDSAQRYQLVIGFLNTLTAVNQVDAVAFVYDEGGVSTGSAASANWQVVTASNSTRTWTTSSSAVAAATWVNLRIEVNAAGNSVSFFVNGSSVATHTTNIPTAAGRELGFGVLLIKSVGVTARTVDVDYIAVDVDLTTARGP